MLYHRCLALSLCLLLTGVRGGPAQPTEPATEQLAAQAPSTMPSTATPSTVELTTTSTAPAAGAADTSPLWRPAEADAKFRLDLQRRMPSGGRTAGPYEQVRITAGIGSYVYLARDVAPALVVAETQPSVWIRSDRPGLQLIARVVLPRTADPRTGQPLTTLIRGSSYNQVGAWQQLQVTDIPTWLTRQARILRSQVGPSVDTREAYVDQLLVNIYGGQGKTTIACEDPQFAGFVPRVAASSSVAAGAASSTSSQVRQVGALEPLAAPATRAREVKINGSVLLVDGRPFLPRILQHQGEPLEVVRGLGFNAIAVDAPPSDELLAEAQKFDIWLVCPPPALEQIPTTDGGLLMRELPAAYDMVLSWNLGSGLSSRQLESTTSLAKQLRLADGKRARPLICSAEAELRAFSRHVDIVVAHRDPLGTSLELADYATWLRERPRFARPGTPLWTMIQTQPAGALQNQLVAMGAGAADVPLEEESIRLLVHTALAAGARGLSFQSSRRLDGSEPATRLRALLLEQINLELELAEPWAAGGSLMTMATTADAQLTAAVLQTERARLLLPQRGGSGAQQVPRLASPGPVSFVVPGVPESQNVYELTPGGMQPMRHRRVTGGMMVTLDEFSFSSRVLITSDPLVIDSLSRRLAKVAPRAAQLQRELAGRTSLMVDEANRQLPPLAKGPATLLAAKASLETADRLLAASDFRGSYNASRRTLELLGQFKRTHWERVASGAANGIDNLATLTGAGPGAAGQAGNQPIVSQPLAVTFGTLAQLTPLQSELQAARRTANLLVAGDFEDLKQLVAAGWQHFQRPQASLQTEVELSATSPAVGKQSLRMVARAAEAGEAGSALVETPPLWITSAPVYVEAGAWLCLKAKVKVPRTITGSVDGLLVLDSLGGEALAQRIALSPEWKEVTLYRVAPAAGPVTITFALTGVGEAWVDDVSVQAIERLSVGRLDTPRPLPTVGPAAMPLR